MQALLLPHQKCLHQVLPRCLPEFHPSSGSIAFPSPPRTASSSGARAVLRLPLGAVWLPPGAFSAYRHTLGADSGVA